VSTVRVSSTIGDLRDDLLRISKEAPVKLSGVVREGIKVGNEIAQTSARRQSGTHGKHYPNAFTTEMHAPAGFVYSGEYGPDAAMPQGGMSFEWGSRNQPPHLDLNKSADLIAPSFGRKVGDAVDELFW
jgi:hypothetical protein